MAARGVPEADQHQFLDLAKEFEWVEVQRKVSDEPSLVNAQPCGRWSALHQASFGGFPDAVLFLLDSKASLEAKTEDGKTPLDVAKKDVVKRLLAPSAGDEAGETSAPKRAKKALSSAPEDVKASSVT
jgi:hypothetical protein